ncbi:MAG: Glucose-1-phosphate thymidylyltransferase [Candidatus Peregrinibacteria bacterium GW2011_GWA2_47_7]|nr:MAG: Glucose-1-phosphate thymidylyltransferase [Candidatus Peregrinibacteria bacterium GW2011_GWA2_47_7]
MKGVILAGGTGTRLFPSTKVINKHLLPVYNKPMIYYPLQTLTESGITDILIISNREHIGAFMNLLGSGSEVNARLTYKVQDGASGIAHAFALAEDFASGESIALILGDNIFTETFQHAVQNFKEGAQIFLKEVSDPKRFGIAEMAGTRVVSVEEKPAHPKSSYAVTGLYFYDATAFDLIKTLTPSGRGELEITDLNNAYVERGSLEGYFLKGNWADAGTHESLLSASLMIQNQEPSLERLYQNEGAVKVSIGVLLYETDEYHCKEYVYPCFESLLKQDYSNLEILVLDNGSTNTFAIEDIKKRFPEITFMRSEKNLGFGAGHNALIRHSSAPFYAALNFDILYEPDFISTLLTGILSSQNIGAVTGKLKQWDFSRRDQENQGKTNFIDSTGLRIRKSHRFEDRGQGEVDYGQYDRREEIFGPSGAAALYRRTALENIAFVNDTGEKEYFDELFFMYKEDIDLAYRLQWAGWKALYVPSAVAYHDRTTRERGHGILQIIRNRKRKSQRVNEWSFLNQELLIQKHFKNGGFSSEVKNATRWYALKTFLYVLFFEPHLFRQYRRLSSMTDQIEKRVLRMPKTSRAEDIESLMEK